LLKTFLLLVVIAVAAAAGYGAWYLGSPVTIRKYPVEIEIPRGAGFRAAMEQLEKSGIAMRRHEFELLARSTGKVRDIKAGSYEILQPVTPMQLLQKLTRGDVTQAEIRLIEGWTFAQFRAALEASPYLLGDSFSAADLLLASVGQWARDMLPAGEPVDGYLARLNARPALARAMKKDAPAG